MSRGNTKRRNEGMSLLLKKQKLDPTLERELLERQRALREDYLWINSRIKQLNSKYKGKFIVVQNKEVVDSGVSPATLLKKIIKSGQKVEDFAIQYIGNCPACLLI